MIMSYLLLMEVDCCRRSGVVLYCREGGGEHNTVIPSVATGTLPIISSTLMPPNITTIPEPGTVMPGLVTTIPRPVDAAQVSPTITPKSDTVIPTNSVSLGSVNEVLVPTTTLNSSVIASSSISPTLNVTPVTPSSLPTMSTPTTPTPTPTTPSNPTPTPPSTPITPSTPIPSPTTPSNPTPSPTTPSNPTPTPSPTSLTSVPLQSMNTTAPSTPKLVPITKVPYHSYSKRGFTYVNNRVVSFHGHSMGTYLKRTGAGKLTININASFKRKQYFVIPNLKGLCNRLQLLAGVYILSSYFQIPIILSKSMGWTQVWDLKEMFPGQFIELPDPGMKIPLYK